MAPKKAGKKPTPSPISSTSSSDDEREDQTIPSQLPHKSTGAALKASFPSMPPQSFSQDDADETSDDLEPTNQDDTKNPAASSDSETESESEEGNDSPPSAKRESRTRAPSVQPAAPKPRSNGAASSSKKPKLPKAGSRYTEEVEKNEMAATSLVSKEENRFKQIPPMPGQSFSQDDADETSDDSEPKNQDDAKNAAASSDPETESESESEEGNDSPPSAKRARAPSVQPAAPKPRSNEAASSSKKPKLPKASSPDREEVEKNEMAATSLVSKEENRFKRIWRQDDEIVILEALVAFKKKRGREPRPAEIDELYGALRMSFHTSFSRFQFKMKLVNLKRRYSKLFADGKLPKNMKKSSHVKNIFDLAKEMWGESNKNNDFGKSKGTGVGRDPVSVNTSGSESEEYDSESSVIDFLANRFKLMDRKSLINSFALLDPAKCKAVEEIWNQLRQREIEFETEQLKAAKKIVKVMKGICAPYSHGKRR